MPTGGVETEAADIAARQRSLSELEAGGVLPAQARLTLQHITQGRSPHRAGSRPHTTGSRPHTAGSRPHTAGS